MDSIEKTNNLKRINLGVDKLIANKLNPNKMSDAEFNMLYDNMEQVGFVDPIFVRDNGAGTYRVIGGHHRLEVAKLIGYDAVPCTVIDDPEFDEDMEKFQMVRMNVIRGKMSPQKFMDLYNSLNGKYAEQVMSDSFGFAEEEEFKKLVTSMSKSLPKDMQKEFAKAAQEIKTIDGLTTLLNKMFTEHGDTLPHGYMVVDFGGKDSIWLRLETNTRKDFLMLGQMVMDKNRTMDDVLGRLIQRLAKGELEDVFNNAIQTSSPLSDKV